MRSSGPLCYSISDTFFHHHHHRHSLAAVNDLNIVGGIAMPNEEGEDEIYGGIGGAGAEALKEERPVCETVPAKTAGMRRGAFRMQ